MVGGARRRAGVGSAPRKHFGLSIRIPYEVAARDAREAHLSKVEGEVLRLVAQGMTNAGIADALGKSPATVKAQVSSVLRKLGAPNRSAAAAWWVRTGGRR